MHPLQEGEPMWRFALILSAILPFISVSRAAEPRQIFSWPAVSARQIAFGYAGDLWVVDRTGGTPKDVVESWKALDCIG